MAASPRLWSRFKCARELLWCNIPCPQPKGPKVSPVARGFYSIELHAFFTCVTGETARYGVHHHPWCVAGRADYRGKSVLRLIPMSTLYVVFKKQQFHWATFPHTVRFGAEKRRPRGLLAFIVSTMTTWMPTPTACVICCDTWRL